MSASKTDVKLTAQSCCLSEASPHSVSSGFGTSTSSGGLFGSTNTTSNPFGGATSLFGGSGFSATQQPGTTVKFNVSTSAAPNVDFLLWQEVHLCWLYKAVGIHPKRMIVECVVIASQRSDQNKMENIKAVCGLKTENTFCSLGSLMSDNVCMLSLPVSVLTAKTLKKKYIYINCTQYCTHIQWVKLFWF